MNPELLAEYAPKTAGSLHISDDTPGKVHYIDVPPFWTKEDLLDLRDFLEKTPVGLTPIWIRIGGKEKDTKFTIESVKELEKWI